MQQQTIQWIIIPWLNTFYRLSTKFREGNVFSRVCLSTDGEVPYDHYPWCIQRPLALSPDMGPHCTGNRHVDMGPHCTGTPFHTHKRDLFKLAHLKTPSPSPDIWLLKHVQLTTGLLASYWNAFLSYPIFGKGVAGNTYFCTTWRLFLICSVNLPQLAHLDLTYPDNYMYQVSQTTHVLSFALIVIFPTFQLVLRGK